MSDCVRADTASNDAVNLIICTTPLQALIARSLIQKYSVDGNLFDLLMFYFKGENSEKINYYFKMVAKLCHQSEIVLLPRKKWVRLFSTPKLLKRVRMTYRTIFTANINSHEVQYLLSKIHFDKLETFDDGSGNLVPSSELYHHKIGWQRLILNKLRRICYKTEDLRRLSRRHHTLYPGQPNIAAPTVPLDLWAIAGQGLPESGQGGLCQSEGREVLRSENGVVDECGLNERLPEKNTADAAAANPAPERTRRILLGQPLLPNAADNAALAESLLRRFEIGEYFPHPRETYRISGAEYIASPLIFEDYLLESLRREPDTRFEVYHLVSTAALNVHAFPRTAVYAARPAEAAFHTPGVARIYDVMAQLGIPIIDIE